MAQYDYDLFVIGAGSGGVRASRISARHGARVAICEDFRVGGTCVIRGCVPKKLLTYAAHFHEDFEDAAGFGWTIGETAHDWKALISNKNTEIDRLNAIYIRLLKDAGVELIEGRGSLVDDHTVKVGDATYTAGTILIATGGWPEMPDIPGIEHALTSNEALELDSLPRRVVIVGGGFIAVEFAGIFNGLGSDVTLAIRRDLPLRGFDEDIRAGLAEELTKKGITIAPNTTITSIEKTADGFSLMTDSEEIIECDAVMYATGRMPNTKGLGLEEVGVHVNKKGAIAVDEYSRTTVENIYAVGDVTDRIALTPVALAEGHAFADTVFGKKPRAVDHSNVASAVFSHPPISSVGLTEAQAREQYEAVDTYVSRFKPMKHTLSGRDERSLMKLVVDRATDRVVGCHMLGADAPEIVQGLAIALKAGATKADFDATIGIHPTAAEEFVTMREKQPDPTTPGSIEPAE
ncbi:MAG: glutathione-disulfide reductase [Alphaproteobacteria bacterium]|nr:glutathione-disulfide reductase [Alphaproteobacteria bacterium]MBU0799331.1 glutathione-disulfide reductase [Alphaproteobacteria bacterium]MBU0888155.1 glutathione-disulfide reductase [Alphaproteobacteria bacterium]MBU1811600.1 glutathione-disulfide reductase [Alphaproteobacteria bacterium]MBU2090881.1 glutathione-disulfide reductase [Alphaproteobacteria bacterium]